MAYFDWEGLEQLIQFKTEFQEKVVIVEENVTVKLS